MELGMIGLGKMGGNMARRLLRAGHRVVGYDSNRERMQELAQEGIEEASSLADLVARLKQPRIVWCMLPAGAATESTMEALIPLLAQGDVVIDGGNANYKDTLRRSACLREHGLHLVDVGTSGGVWGLSEGYCLMVGGEEQVVQRLAPIFEALAPAPDKGWGYVGPNGAGHFVKMVHNGIEYGLMQAYAEGFEILHAKKEFHLDLAQIAQIWRYGSVIRSWLLDLTAAALQEDQTLSGIKGWVADSGEGRWTVVEAIDLDVPAPTLTLALLMRLASRQEESYAAKLLAVMRKWFGGHEVKRVEGEGMSNK
ncbi:MAG: decarboxylating 6-phosphogluconate dehydrogenase [Chloroflexi bacterium]|nr:decarboxylating 6-phosphogluconate dehydrogenase [Chloroflexota bacterium]